MWLSQLLAQLGHSNETLLYIDGKFYYDVYLSIGEEFAVYDEPSGNLLKYVND